MIGHILIGVKVASVFDPLPAFFLGGFVVDVTGELRLLDEIEMAHFLVKPQSDCYNTQSHSSQARPRLWPGSSAGRAQP